MRNNGPQPSLRDLFDELVALPAAECRQRLQRMESSSPGLKRELERLLEGHLRASAFFEHESNWDIPLDMGDRIAARYEVRSKLGEGAMGTVYRVWDREARIEIALKLLNASHAKDEFWLSRFRREMVLARSITHRNVVRIFDIGQDGPRRFITMEYLRGHTLHTAIQNKQPLPVSRRLDILAQIAAGMAEAHANQIIHRDLKPHNVMLHESGRVVIMDFGIARTLSPDDPRSRVTVTTKLGAVVGTPGYMSPEQQQGRALSERSDLYSFGALAFYVMTGEELDKLPHGKSARQALQQTPFGVARLILRCLSPKESHRPKSFQDLLDKLTLAAKPKPLDTLKSFWPIRRMLLR
jgi:serine/threonine-protein kinase